MVLSVGEFRKTMNALGAMRHGDLLFLKDYYYIRDEKLPLGWEKLEGTFTRRHGVGKDPARLGRQAWHRSWSCLGHRVLALSRSQCLPWKNQVNQCPPCNVLWSVSFRLWPEPHPSASQRRPAMSVVQRMIEDSQSQPQHNKIIEANDDLSKRTRLFFSFPETVKVHPWIV